MAEDNLSDSSIRLTSTLQPELGDNIILTPMLWDHEHTLHDDSWIPTASCSWTAREHSNNGGYVCSVVPERRNMCERQQHGEKDMRIQMGRAQRAHAPNGNHGELCMEPLEGCIQAVAGISLPVVLQGDGLMRRLLPLAILKVRHRVIVIAILHCHKRD